MNFEYFSDMVERFYEWRKGSTNEKEAAMKATDQMETDWKKQQLRLCVIIRERK